MSIIGGTKSLSASERLKRKKAGLVYNDSSTNPETVTKLTELANKILSGSGNMDIYQETFEEIKKKVRTRFLRITFHFSTKLTVILLR